MLFPAAFQDGGGSTWAVTQEQASRMWMGRDRVAVLESYYCVILGPSQGTDRGLERAAWM